MNWQKVVSRLFTRPSSITNARNESGNHRDINQGRQRIMSCKSVEKEKVDFKWSTRFGKLAPFSAIVVISVLVVVIGYGIIAFNTEGTDANRESNNGEDLRCYRSIVERIHAGEGYYEAAGSELRSRGYATESVFNWRMPLLAWFLGHLPGAKTGQALAFVLALVSLVIWISVLQRYYSFGPLLIGGLLLSGPLIYSLLPGIFLAHEYWAGTLITLSLAAHARRWRVVSVLSGLTALFIRELTLPYVCVMCMLSYIEDHKREALVWLIGMLAFGTLFFYHFTIVRDLITEGNLIQEGGWVAFGGWRFVLSTAQMHPFLFLAPACITAGIFPFMLLGLAGWHEREGLRVALTVLVFAAAYLFFGKPYNRYWGLMYTSLMPIGLLFAPHSLRDLLLSARRIWMKERT